MATLFADQHTCFYHMVEVAMHLGGDELRTFVAI